MVYDSCNTFAMGNRIIWIGTTATARAICYALNAVYKAKGKKKEPT